MPWKESRIVDQRLRFLSTYQKEEMSVFRALSRVRSVTANGEIFREAQLQCSVSLVIATHPIRRVPATLLLQAR